MMLHDRLKIYKLIAWIIVSFRSLAKTSIAINHSSTECYPLFENKVIRNTKYEPEQVHSQERSNKKDFSHSLQDFSITPERVPYVHNFKKFKPKSKRSMMHENYHKVDSNILNLYRYQNYQNKGKVTPFIISSKDINKFLRNKREKATNVLNRDICNSFRSNEYD